MTRATRANPPPLHRAIGPATVCGLKLGSHFDRHWRHPRLPEHARPFWHDGVRVIWATAICEDISCAKCKEMPK